MQGKLVVEVKRLSVKAGKQAAKAVRQPRQATVRLRCLRVELPAKRKAPVELTHIREENPPADDERRFLLTTLPSAADAERTWRGLRRRRLFSRLELRPEPDHLVEIRDGLFVPSQIALGGAAVVVGFD